MKENIMASRSHILHPAAVPLAALVAFGLGGKSTHADNNLITNGGFETGDFTGYSQSGNLFGTDVQSLVGDYGPHSGSNYALLGPSQTDGILTQLMATTIGQDYIITFYLASDGNTPNNFSASFGGTTFFSQTDIPEVSPVSPKAYVMHTFDQVATSASTALQFQFRNDKTAFALDDISVTPRTVASVPEPSSLLLMAVGLLGLGGPVFVARRKSAHTA